MRYIVVVASALASVLVLSACDKQSGATHADHATHTAQADDPSCPSGSKKAHGAEECADDEKADKAAQQRVDRETVDQDGVVRRGQKLSDAKALTVTELSQQAGDLDGKAVKVSGAVDSVCQPMGCWFVIKGEGGESIRVTSKSHDVFLPKSSAGRLAVAEGELKVKTLSKEQAQHFEDEKELKPGEERKVFTGDVKELSLALTAVELRPQT